MASFSGPDILRTCPFSHCQAFRTFDNSGLWYPKGHWELGLIWPGSAVKSPSDTVYIPRGACFSPQDVNLGI